MDRTPLAWVMLGLVAATAGCSMCQHPYDYCYPLFTGGCDGPPCVGHRAGSILATADSVAPQPEPMPPGQVEPYYDQSSAAPIAPQPQMQSRWAVPRLQMPWRRNATTSRQAAADAGQLIPAADRQNAQILSVTDETLEEAQARSQVAGQPPASVPATTLR
jgi:hypothetical protein